MRQNIQNKVVCLVGVALWAVKQWFLLLLIIDQWDYICTAPGFAALGRVKQQFGTGPEAIGNGSIYHFPSFEGKNCCLLRD